MSASRYDPSAYVPQRYRDAVESSKREIGQTIKDGGCPVVRKAIIRSKHAPVDLSAPHPITGKPQIIKTTDLSLADVARIADLQNSGRGRSLSYEHTRQIGRILNTWVDPEDQHSMWHEVEIDDHIVGNHVALGKLAQASFEHNIGVSKKGDKTEIVKDPLGLAIVSEGRRPNTRIYPVLVERKSKDSNPGDGGSRSSGDVATPTVAVAASNSVARVASSVTTPTVASVGVATMPPPPSAAAATPLEGGHLPGPGQSILMSSSSQLSAASTGATPTPAASADMAAAAAAAASAATESSAASFASSEPAEAQSHAQTQMADIHHAQLLERLMHNETETLQRLQKAELENAELKRKDAEMRQLLAQKQKQEEARSVSQIEEIQGLLGEVADTEPSETLAFLGSLRSNPEAINSLHRVAVAASRKLKAAQSSAGGHASAGGQIPPHLLARLQEYESLRRQMFKVDGVSGAPSHPVAQSGGGGLVVAASNRIASIGGSGSGSGSGSSATIAPSNASKRPRTEVVGADRVTAKYSCPSFLFDQE